MTVIIQCLVFALPSFSRVSEEGYYEHCRSVLHDEAVSRLRSS
jgi:hypothetical protein